jgi:hypothetical protein
MGGEQRWNAGWGGGDGGGGGATEEFNAGENRKQNVKNRRVDLTSSETRSGNGRFLAYIPSISPGW